MLPNETLRKERSLVDAGEIEKNFDVEEREVPAADHTELLRAAQGQLANSGPAPSGKQHSQQVERARATLLELRGRVDQLGARLARDERLKIAAEWNAFLDAHKLDLLDRLCPQCVTLIALGGSERDGVLYCSDECRTTASVRHHQKRKVAVRKQKTANQKRRRSKHPPQH